MDYSERMLRREIATLPDGTYRATGWLDGLRRPSGSGVQRICRIEVAVTIDGADIVVDLTGSSPQVDLPINMPFVGTVDVAVWVTLRSLLLDCLDPRAGADELGALPGDPDRRAGGLHRQSSLPRSDDRAILPGEHRSPTRLMRALAPVDPGAV